MNRHTRYQGAIVRDHHVLLIRHREHDTGVTYWLLPGGGIEDGETEEGCVRREMREETNLEVSVERLLLDEASDPGGIYQWRRTCLCSVVSGTATPGYEPEMEAAAKYGIVEVKWFDLRNSDEWNALVKTDYLTCPQLQRVQKALGYIVSG